VHRAAARAARRTGLAITTHAVLSGVGLAQLRIFEEEGADPSRVVIGHADSYPSLDHYIEIVRRGANLEFDFLGMGFTPMERFGEGRVIELLLELLSRGHGGRLLLSQDVCHNGQLTRYGGNGYTYLQRTFLPRLREAGASDADVHRLTVENPRRILAVG
jgi:predicted metal-dependent phosphotriesterase family hydrolase